VTLKSPFPYFGGKARAASMVWQRLGACRNYVEPFFGSGAVLLNRPTPFDGTETVNDADGLLANFWRALRADPDAVADHADWPVNENDLHARHAWLVGQKDAIQSRLEGDPDFFDAKVAGWWVWGMACWIGSGFCLGKGPWHQVNGELVNTAEMGKGAWRQLVHLGSAGRGVNRQRDDHREGLFAYFHALSDRLRHVRVCCGDWTRVTGGDSGEALSWHFNASGTPVAVFLDPPYADTAKRNSDLYRVDSLSVAHAVREWAIAHGDDPRYRIALCGYEGEHAMPETWEAVEGKGGGGHGYGGQTKGGYANKGRERIWFSPHCLRPGNESMPLLESTA
jgi:DNA adenine methylase